MYEIQNEWEKKREEHFMKCLDVHANFCCCCFSFPFERSNLVSFAVGLQRLKRHITWCCRTIYSMFMKCDVRSTTVDDAIHEN